MFYDSVRKAFQIFVLIGWTMLGQAHAMSIEDFLTLFGESNEDLQSFRLQQQALHLQKSQSLLRYQPFLVGGWDYRNSKETGFLSFLGEEDQLKQQDFSLGLQKGWRTGTQTSIRQNFSRYSFDIRSPQSQIPEETVWSNRVELQVSQDLWRNVLGREQWQASRAEQLRLEAEAMQIAFRIEQLFIQAEQAYWAYALVKERANSVLASLKRAQGILDWNQKRLELKVIDRGDFLQSQARVFELEEALLNTKRQLEENARELYFLLNRNEEEELFSGLTSLKVDIQIPTGFSIDNREDIKALQLQVEASRREQTSVDSSQDPSLKLMAMYQGNSSDTSFSDAQSEALGGDFRAFQLGLQLELPLGFGRQADVKAAAEKRLRSSELQLSRAKKLVENDFEDLVDRLSELQKRIALAEKRQSTEKQKLSNEEGRFRQGRSSSFQVLSFQEDLSQAELDLLRLYAEVRQTMAALKAFD